MSGSEVAQLITALATLIAAVGTLIVGVLNTRKIEVVHKATNSLVDRLVKEGKDASFLAGEKAEKEKGK